MSDTRKLLFGSIPFWMSKKFVKRVNSVEMEIFPGYYWDSANWSDFFRFGNEFGILAELDNLDSALVMIWTRFRWSGSFRSRQLRIPMTACQSHRFLPRGQKEENYENCDFSANHCLAHPTSHDFPISKCIPTCSQCSFVGRNQHEMCGMMRSRLCPEARVFCSRSSA